MKEKGFTLVELLGVIVILIAIFVLVFPAVNSLIDDGKKVTHDAQINTILKAAYDFSLKNPSYLKEKGEKSFVTLGELKYEGLVDSDIKDPNTKKLFVDNLVVSINNVGSGYKYTSSNSMLEGDYLYTVETELLDDSSYVENMPVINLTGLTKESDEYVEVVNLNANYVEPSYSATSYTSVDLTSNVKINKYLNDLPVDSVDTSKFGLYKLKYTVIDEEGYANSATLNLIVADQEAPAIQLEESTTINITDTSYDLMKGVTCKDNSGICNITYTGSITFGTPDKYVIEYTAQDKSGNTATRKRSITVE